MGRQAYSGLALANAAQRRGHTISQSTVSRLCTGRQDPTLSVVHALADTLGVPDWFLLTEREQVEERIVRAPSMTNVVKIPSPYPSVMHGNKPTSAGKGRQRGTS
jgi:transcriptional regulator with XRE-family HTH domain